ncbi:MAG TPA: ATP-binding protein [Bacilli bacterium]|nr:ATP-binding protein [Bacilli bacterium]
MNSKEIEKSIIKKYRKEIWSQFIKAIKEYKLINDNDKLAVCISGGKDSFLMAKCIEELQKHNKIKFEVKYIIMDPGYNNNVLELVENNIKKLNINAQIFSTNIFSVADKISKETPCYLCARMRRGHLYNIAKTLECNKIVLGHHFDDVIETILLNILYAGEIKTMMPKVKSKNFKGLELIRPMYFVREKDIISWAKYNDLQFINCACKFTEEVENKEHKSKRKDIKELIKELQTDNKYVENNIFNSVSNINLNAIIGYTKDNIKTNFLDDYDKK